MKALTPQVAVVIVAGGSGTRIGGPVSKQFLTLGGKPVFKWSLEYFAAQPLVQRICLVVPAAAIDVVTAHTSHLCLPVPLQIVEGGCLRQDSVAAGVRAVATSQFVAVHDGARPFPPDNLAALLEAAAASDGAITGLPATDCTKRVHGDIIQETLRRQELWTIQTPQLFKTETLLSALTFCETHNIEVTDDASAVEATGGQVKVVPGTRTNIKLTYAEDIMLAEAIIAGRNSHA